MKPLPATISIAPRATAAFIECTSKFAWNRIAAGPSTPSSMCTWNQCRSAPHDASARRRLRTTYDKSATIAPSPITPRP
jgi:hypothetical protein